MPNGTATKPEWLKIRLEKKANFSIIKGHREKKGLSTVCEEAHCPNITKCWNSGTATFMVLGSTCTRGCRFCAVNHAIRVEQVDMNEPENLLNTIKNLKLDYVVITSVDRDDLPDQGAGHIAECISKLKGHGILVEALVPDFRGNEGCIRAVVSAKPDVFAHNIETVERLQAEVRDPRANYSQSLSVLRAAKKSGARFTKSSIMVGLGEKKDEVLETMKCLRENKVDFLTVGQYLQPSGKHIQLKEYVAPDVFLEYEKAALGMGFLYCASGPLIRSSYRAGDYFRKVTGNA